MDTGVLPSTDRVRVSPSVQPVMVSWSLSGKKEPLTGEDTSRAGATVSTEKALVYRKASPWLLAPWKVRVWEPSDRLVRDREAEGPEAVPISFPSSVQVPPTVWPSTSCRVAVNWLVR